MENEVKKNNWGDEMSFVIDKNLLKKEEYERLKKKFEGEREE